MKIDWLIVIFSFFLVLAIVPFTDTIFPNLGEGTIDTNLNLIINILVFFTFFIFLIFLIMQRGAPLSSYLSLVAIFVISFYFLMHVEASRDRLHFVGYGILSLLVFRALRHNISTQMLYVIAGLILLSFAILDEVFQIFFPPRNFDIKDIGTDILSSLIGQALIAFVLRPKLESADVKIRRYAQNLRNLKYFRVRNHN